MHLLSTAVPNVFHPRISLQIPRVYSNKGKGESPGSPWLIDKELISDYFPVFLFFLHCSSGGLCNWAENWTNGWGGDRLLWGCLASGLTLHARAACQVLSSASVYLFWLGHETSIIFVSSAAGTFLLLVSILHPAGLSTLAALSPFPCFAALATHFLALTIDGNMFLCRKQKVASRAAIAKPASRFGRPVQYTESFKG